MQAEDAIAAGEVMKVGMSLVVIVFAILVVGWMYSRVQGVRGPKGKVFTIVASQQLGPKERILLIDVAGKQLVLGVTASQIQTLLIPDSEMVTLPEVARTSGFADRLRYALRGNSA